MKFTREQLDAHRGQTVPDLLPEDLKLLFVGINPSLWTAATGAHFARPGNRFYPALFQAGITDRLIDASSGYSEEDLEHLRDRGIGVSNLVPVATARADELTSAQLREAPARLTALVTEHRPRVVSVLGITSYRQAFRQPKAKTGEQPSPWSDVRLFVLPNPSGLNAHESVASLAAAYAEAATAAGIELY